MKKRKRMKGKRKVGQTLNTKKFEPQLILTKERTLKPFAESTLAPWLGDSCAIEDCDHKKAYYGDFAASERLNKKSDTIVMSDDFYGVKGQTGTGDIESLSKPLDVPVTHIVIDEENITKGVPTIDPEHLEKSESVDVIREDRDTDHQKSGLDYSKTEVNADGSTSTPYITDQDNPAIKEYVAAVEAGPTIFPMSEGMKDRYEKLITPPLDNPSCQWCGTNDERDHTQCHDEMLKKKVEPQLQALAEQQVSTPIVKQEYSHDQLLQALYWIFDAFERSNMTFFVIYNTAESVLEQKDLEGDKITVGIRDMIWVSGARQIFDTYVQYKDKVDNKLTYIADNGVPVEVIVFPDDECIMSPDTKMYHSEAFHLPNPYSRFLEVYK